VKRHQHADHCHCLPTLIIALEVADRAGEELLRRFFARRTNCAHRNSAHELTVTWNEESGRRTPETLVWQGSASEPTVANP